MSVQQMFFSTVTRATGGTQIDSGGYRTHVFTTSGTFTLLSVNPGITVQIFVCGGGLSGAQGDPTDPDTNENGGGGGGGNGGGYTLTSEVPIGNYFAAGPGSSNSVTVGAVGGQSSVTTVAGVINSGFSSATGGFQGEGGGVTGDGGAGSGSISLDWTGTTCFFGGGGGGGGGGGSNYNGYVAGAGGAGGNSAAGNGGAGGSGMGGNGVAGASATSPNTYDRGNGGGGGGGAAGGNGSVFAVGGVGGTASAGIVMIRYKL